ncbi:ArsC/Spx/MgsR family protein [Lactococcus garvieae]|uniref:ArsC/Spx/MgsR family protein n=1 Tax=Lactococcus garvieae TaxID=1363 RepID=UPI00398E382B
MILNEAINYIKVNPDFLRSPIIIEKDKVLIGYNPEQIRMFLPKEYRRKSLGKNTE